VNVSVDPWRCQGHMQCVAIAPELFWYDDDLSHAVAVGTTLEPVALELARHAVSACPEQAVTLAGDDEP
jgi:ferredoxin